MAGIELREGDAELLEKLGCVVKPGGPEELIEIYDGLIREERDHFINLAEPYHPRTLAEHHYRKQRRPWRTILATVKR